MTLKVNEMYKTATGYLIPRSHLKAEKGTRYAIVQIITGGEVNYTTKHTILSSGEIRKALGLPKGERVDIS